MKDRLETEIIDKESRQEIEVSCEWIEARLEQGIAAGSFSVKSREGKLLKGYLGCTDPRMQLNPVKFQGESIEIQYSFDGSRLQPKETVEGFICLVSNYGEAEIGYRIRQSERKAESSLGEIRNLFHFTNLARASWDEAVRLFFQPEFSLILSSASAEERELYRGLKGTGKEQCVEEFLLAIRKKTPVVYSVENTVLAFENVEEDQREELCIDREGWGYTELHLEKEGKFFSLEANRLTENDFLGNRCHLPLYLHADRLHQGKNYGSITLEYAYGKLFIEVVVSQNQHHRMKVAIEKRRSMKRMRIQLTELYMDFRSKRIAASHWRKETEQLLDKMRTMDSRNPQGRLFMAHLYISSDKLLEAKWLLDRVESLVQEGKDPTVYAYYLYLTTLIKGEEEYQQLVKEKVEELYYSQEGHWQIAWLMLHLSRELRGHAQRKWDFLQQVFQAGCTSPVLYTEAVLLLNYQPTLLMGLGPVELRILRFGQSRDMLSEEVRGVLQYLSLKEKEYSKGLFRLLETICLTEDNVLMLQSLCSLLIKGNKKGERYFPWYEKAVYKGLKITRLYEYYMMSLDRGKKMDIPRMVLMYFSYETSLSYPNAAYLYRYVYENRKIMEELYLAYAPRIERFILKQLHNGKINRDLGYLYEHILVPDMLTPDNAKALERLMFIHSFHTSDIGDEKLVAVHKHLKEEAVYGVCQGKTRLLLMGKNYLLFRENRYGQRFLIPEGEVPTSFLSVSAVAERLVSMNRESLGLALHICEENGGWQPIDQDNEEAFLFLSENTALLEEERQDLRSRLLDYYDEEEKLGYLDEWLEACNEDALGLKDRKKLIHYLLSRGLYEKAFRFVKNYGPDQMEPKALVRIATYMMEEEELDLDGLIWIADTAFRQGKYNLSMLNFLAENYWGTCRRMAILFNAVREFEGDAYQLSERLLTQMLFSKTAVKEDVEIFKLYVAGGAKTHLESAFLSWCSKACLLGEREMDGYFIRDIARVYRRGEKLHPVTHLAYLKYYAYHREERQQADEKLLQSCLQEMIRKRELHLPFLLEYSEYPDMETLAEKTFLFYQGKPGEHVVLHYQKSGVKEDEAYLRESMDELYGGMFSREFILFAGEGLDYYITCEQENQEQLTASGVLSARQKEQTSPVSRFQRINQMAIRLEDKAYDRVEELLEEYCRMDDLVRKAFRI